MQVSKLALKRYDWVGGARDITCTAGAGAIGFDRLGHRLQDGGVLTHSEIVVTAPDGNIANFLTTSGVAPGVRIVPGTAR